MNKIDYKQGIKFECQGSSNCCVSRNSYGFVYLSNKDIKELSVFTKLPIEDFLKLYCEKSNGFTHLKERSKNGNCLFLKEKKCSVYKARPTQCRTWPFWAENMNQKKWNQELSIFCPGIGMGKVITKEEIDKNINKEEKKKKKMLREIK